MGRHIGGTQVFRGPMYQDGYGLGGYFRRFFKWIVPIAQTHALPHLRSGLNAIKNQALDSVANIARDAADGRDVRASVQERVSEAIDSLKNKVERKLRGEGRGRKRKRIVLKKNIHNDIFNQF